MKTKKHLPAIFVTMLASLLILISCSSPKMSAVPCPEFPGSRYYKTASVHKIKKHVSLTTNRWTDVINRHVSLTRKSQAKNFHETKESVTNEMAKVPGTDKIAYINKSEYSEALTVSADNTFIPKLRTSSGINPHLIADSNGQSTNLATDQKAGCDTIIMKSGSRIIGKVEEIGQSEIRYRRCDNINGPVISIAKSGVYRILYVNGTHEVLVSDSPIVVNNNRTAIMPVNNNAPLKTEPLAIAGFVSSLVGLFVAGILLGTLGVVFGAISLRKIKREPGRFKGRGLAIASIIVGIIAVVGAIIVLAAM